MLTSSHLASLVILIVGLLIDKVHTALINIHTISVRRQ